MAKVLLLARGTGGDVFPLVQIGCGLKARGHDVTLLSHCIYADRAGKAGVDFVALDDPEESQHMLENAPRCSQDVVSFFKRYLFPKIHQDCEKIAGRCRAGETILVSTQDSRVVAQLAAEKLEIPLVIVCAAPSMAMSVPSLSEAYSHHLGTDINLARSRIGLLPVQDWIAWERAFERGVGLWPDWFAATDLGWPVGVTPVGFIADNEPMTKQGSNIPRDLLGRCEAPILITHGTSDPLDSRFFRVGVEACQILGRPGILVTQHEKLIPRPLPDEIEWVKYIPYMMIMPHVAAVIHHGGIGTSSQALAAGVPQLVLALGFDRPDNAVHLQELGVATFFLPSQWEPARVAEALRALMSSRGVQERCQEMAHRMKDMNAHAVATACDVIERASESGSVSGIRAGYCSVPVQTEPQAGDTNKPVEALKSLAPERRAWLAQRLRREKQDLSILQQRLTPEKDRQKP